MTCRRENAVWVRVLVREAESARCDTEMLPLWRDFVRDWEAVGVPGERVKDAAKETVAPDRETLDVLASECGAVSDCRVAVCDVSSVTDGERERVEEGAGVAVAPVGVVVAVWVGLGVNVAGTEGVSPVLDTVCWTERPLWDPVSDAPRETDHDLLLLRPDAVAVAETSNVNEPLTDGLYVNCVSVTSADRV